MVQQHISVCMIFNMFTFTQTMLKMAFTASCECSLSRRQEHRAEKVREHLPPPCGCEWNYTEPSNTLKEKVLFWGEDQFLFHSTAHFWVQFLSSPFSDFSADVQIHDLGWFKSSVISNESTSTNPRHGHSYTVNPQPWSKKHSLKKGGGKKQTSWTSTKFTSDWNSTAQDNKYKLWHIS